MKHIFIINPIAGKIDILNTVNTILDVSELNKLDYKIEFTRSAGDATILAEKYAKEYNNDCVIYSIGGDGTLNEVVNGMNNTNATLGVIPFGSGNDFYRLLSNNRENVIERTVNGTPENINIGKVNNKYFTNIASIGYDANVAFNVSLMKESKIVPNNMVYVASIFYSLLAFKHPQVRISFNDMTIEQKITILAICNGQYYGNGIPIAPNANFKDNLFDICLADEVNKAEIPVLLASVLKGNHGKYDFVHTYQTDHIKVEADQILNCNVDGEIIRSDNFEFSMNKDKIKVLKPR